MRNLRNVLLRRILIAAVIGAGLVAAGKAQAGVLVFSAASAVNVKAGVSTDQAQYQRGDLIAYDMISGHVSLYAQILGNTGNLDAVAVLSNGSVVVSTAAQQTLGGNAYRPGDLIQYNIQTNTYSLYMKGNVNTVGTDAFGNTTSVFANNDNSPTNANIDAVEVYTEGGTTWVLVSAADGFRLRGTSFPWEKLGTAVISNNTTTTGNAFDNNDIVKYDPLNHVVDSFFDFGLHVQSGNQNVKAVSWLADEGVYLFSTNGTTTMLNAGNPVTFGPADIFKLNPVTGAATLFFSASDIFAQSENVFAIDYLSPVPEPSSLAIFGIGAASMAGCIGRRRKQPVAAA